MADVGNSVEVNEKSRTYYFPNGATVELTEVTEIVVRESGAHRLKTRRMASYTLSRLAGYTWRSMLTIGRCE